LFKAEDSEGSKLPKHEASDEKTRWNVVFESQVIDSIAELSEGMEGGLGRWVFGDSGDVGLYKSISPDLSPIAICLPFGDHETERISTKRSQRKKNWRTGDWNYFCSGLLPSSYQSPPPNIDNIDVMLEILPLTQNCNIFSMITGVWYNIQRLCSIYGIHWFNLSAV